MKRFLLAAAGAFLAAALGSAQARAPAPLGKADKPAPNPLQLAEEEKTCHGTSFHFENTPAEAAKLAKKQEKLVFILHISGNFENSGET